MQIDVKKFLVLSFWSGAIKCGLMQEFLNKIICGDCNEVLSGINTPLADLIFADPPFNIGYKYDKYYDKVEGDKYIAWTRDWMTACKKVLKPAGSFYIAIGDDYAANVKIIADQLTNDVNNMKWQEFIMQVKIFSSSIEG